MPSRALTRDELRELADIAFKLNFYAAALREVLLRDLPPRFHATLTDAGPPDVRLLSHLHALNEHETVAELPRRPIAVWLENATQHAQWHRASQTGRLRELCLLVGGQPPPPLAASTPHTVGEAVDLALRFDRTQPWGYFERAVADNVHLFMTVVGCDQQGINYFLRRVGRMCPAPDAEVVYLPFRETSDGAGPQIQAEWNARLASKLRADSPAKGIERVTMERAVVIVIGPLPADELTEVELRALDGFLAEELRAMVDATRYGRLYVIVGAEYTKSGLFPFSGKRFARKLAKRATLAGFSEDGTTQRLRTPSELKIPPWGDAEAILFQHGVSEDMRDRLEDAYSEWRTTRTLHQITRLLKRSIEEDKRS